MILGVFAVTGTSAAPPPHSEGDPPPFEKPPDFVQIGVWDNVELAPDEGLSAGWYFAKPYSSIKVYAKFEGDPSNPSNVKVFTWDAPVPENSWATSGWSNWQWRPTGGHWGQAIALDDEPYSYISFGFKNNSDADIRAFLAVLMTRN